MGTLFAYYKDEDSDRRRISKKTSYGPRQTPAKSKHTHGTLHCDFKFSPFSCTQRRGYMKDSTEKEYSQTLRQSLSPAIRLDLLPKSTIDVFVQVLESDGSAACLAAAITCASMALANAGVEMFDVVAGCAVVCLIVIR